MGQKTPRSRREKTTVFKLTSSPPFTPIVVKERAIPTGAYAWVVDFDDSRGVNYHTSSMIKRDKR